MPEHILPLGTRLIVRRYTTPEQYPSGLYVAPAYRTRSGASGLWELLALGPKADEEAFAGAVYVGDAPPNFVPTLGSIVQTRAWHGTKADTLVDSHFECQCWWLEAENVEVIWPWEPSWEDESVPEPPRDFL